MQPLFSSNVGKAISGISIGALASQGGTTRSLEEPRLASTPPPLSAPEGARAHVVSGAAVFAIRKLQGGRREQGVSSTRVTDPTPASTMFLATYGGEQHGEVGGWVGWGGVGWGGWG